MFIVSLFCVEGRSTVVMAPEFKEEHTEPEGITRRDKYIDHLCGFASF